MRPTLQGRENMFCLQLLPLKRGKWRRRRRIEINLKTETYGVPLNKS